MNKNLQKNNQQPHNKRPMGPSKYVQSYQPQKYVQETLSSLEESSIQQVSKNISDIFAFKERKDTFLLDMGRTDLNKSINDSYDHFKNNDYMSSVVHCEVEKLIEKYNESDDSPTVEKEKHTAKQLWHELSEMLPPFFKREHGYEQLKNYTREKDLNYCRNIDQLEQVIDIMAEVIPSNFTSLVSTVSKAFQAVKGIWLVYQVIQQFQQQQYEENLDRILYAFKLKKDRPYLDKKVTICCQAIAAFVAVKFENCVLRNSQIEACAKIITVAIFTTLLACSLEIQDTAMPASMRCKQQERWEQVIVGVLVRCELIKKPIESFDESLQKPMEEDNDYQKLKSQKKNYRQDVQKQNQVQVSSFGAFLKPSNNNDVDDKQD